jgi:two-component sensor histidine kinase/CheY-like chemotaxis protein
MAVSMNTRNLKKALLCRLESSAERVSPLLAASRQNIGKSIATSPSSAQACEDSDELTPLSGGGEGVVNILIVDDEPKNLTVLETVLDSPRYRVIRAESADNALLALLRHDFAVLILDVQMPGITGFELAQMIKERKKTSEVPIIFLTAYYNEDQHVIEGYDSGAVDYLLKPINPAILRSKVSALAELFLKQRQLEDANRALSAEVAERRLVQQQLSELNETLEQRVLDRTEAHKQAEQQIRMLMNEVNHRSKNLLSVVTAIAQQTAASSPQEFVKKFSGRVQALAVNHDLLVKSQWRCIDATELIGGQLAHFGDLLGKRILFQGPPIRVSSAAAQSIGMVVHELSTNTVKYGALSGEEGRIDIRWEIDSGAEPMFSICWTECNGPPIVAPTRRGFGTTVVTKMVEMSLDGETVLDYTSTGLIWRLVCPLKNVLEGMPL